MGLVELMMWVGCGGKGGVWGGGCKLGVGVWVRVWCWCWVLVLGVSVRC